MSADKTSTAPLLGQTPSVIEARHPSHRTAPGGVVGCSVALGFAQSPGVAGARKGQLMTLQFLRVMDNVASI